MFEEILKEFFGTTKTFDDLFNEVFDNKVNTDEVKDENNHSYFHSVKDKYENGEHISHSEKEIKDGKVIKDVDNCLEIENKENCKCNDNACKCDKKLCEKKETEKEELIHNLKKFFSNRKDCTCHDYDALKGFNKQLEESLKKYSELYVDSQRALVQKDKKIAELESKLNEVKRVTWKPTKEQLDALQYVIKHYTPDATDKLAWNSIKTLGLMYLNNFDI